MLLKFVVSIASFLAAGAQTGPSALYTLLNGLTFNPPGYTINMYQNCVQNQNAGNPCGSYSGFQSSGGQYTYQLYGPEAPVSAQCSRTFKLALACGPTLQMSGVNENPTCVYSATLMLPQVCGVDMTVGNEAASVSPTAPPPTASSTMTLTATGTPTITASTTTTLTATPTATSTLTLTATPTGTATSTPLFQITAWPTTTTTQTLTATSTPLFMITAWPTPSPVNVSAPSTPLYYYTAYPSVGSNVTGPVASAAAESSSSTATILGSVALGVVALGAIGGAVAYFRGGGTLGGLIGKVKEHKGDLAKFANALPISAEQKAKLTGAIEDPSSLVPAQAQAALAQAQAKVEELKGQAEAAKQSLVSVLPSQLAEIVTAKEAEVKAQVAALVQAQKETIQQKVAAISSFAPVAVAPVAVTEVADKVLEKVAQATEVVESVAKAVEVVENIAQASTVVDMVTAVAKPATAASAVNIAMSPEELEIFKVFLAQKAEVQTKE
jgi:hypothetical protein